MTILKTTRYVIERKRSREQQWALVCKLSYVDSAKNELHYFNNTYPEYKHRLVRETDTREVIG